jgi:hypothetical protein
MYQTVYLDERVALTPNEMNIVRHPDEIKSVIETKLKELHEGKCNANGYIRPGSIKLIGRSMGVAENGKFTGNIVFDCKFSCEILYPTADMELDVMIVKVNKMGAYTVFEEAIRILLPRDLPLGNEAFDNLQESNTVRIRLIRSRFQSKDTFIMAVGKLLDGSTPAEEKKEED